MKIIRNSLSAVALAGVICTVAFWARAQEKMSGDHMMMHGDSM